jgi:hypothetical protein
MACGSCGPDEPRKRTEGAKGAKSAEGAGDPCSEATLGKIVMEMLSHIPPTVNGYFPFWRFRPALRAPHRLGRSSPALCGPLARRSKWAKGAKGAGLKGEGSTRRAGGRRDGGCAPPLPRRGAPRSPGRGGRTGRRPGGTGAPGPPGAPAERPRGRAVPIAFFTFAAALTCFITNARADPNQNPTKSRYNPDPDQSRSHQDPIKVKSRSNQGGDPPSSQDGQRQCRGQTPARAGASALPKGAGGLCRRGEVKSARASV